MNKDPSVRDNPVDVSNMTEVSNDGVANCRLAVRNGENEDFDAKQVYDELLSAERQYIEDLGSILKGYIGEMESTDLKDLLPPGLKGKSDILYGNLGQIYCFHNQIILPALECCCSSSPESIARCFTENKGKLLPLYTFYCVNATESEKLRESVGENNSFFKACQEKLGHISPLSEYLLLPLKRIVGYQRFFQELLHVEKDQNDSTELLQIAHDCMQDIFNGVNNGLIENSIVGYDGDLNDLGGILLQGSFSVRDESKSGLLKRWLRPKSKTRHVFLYPQGLLVCKTILNDKKITYKCKTFLRMDKIGLTKTVDGDACKFKIFLDGRKTVYTIQALNTQQKHQWVSEIQRQSLKKLFDGLKGDGIERYTNAFVKRVNERKRTQVLDKRSKPGTRPPGRPREIADDGLSGFRYCVPGDNNYFKNKSNNTCKYEPHDLKKRWKSTKPWRKCCVCGTRKFWPRSMLECEVSACPFRCHAECRDRVIAGPVSRGLEIAVLAASPPPRRMPGVKLPKA